MLKASKELLDNNYYRSAVLEAQTALEVFIHKTIFSLLKYKVGKELKDFIKEKSRFDFDSIFKTIIPYTTNLPIDRTTDLWRHMKEVKNLRNKIVHDGISVSEKEAKKAYKSTYKLLAFLSIAKVKQELYAYRENVKNSNEIIDSESAAELSFKNNIINCTDDDVQDLAVTKRFSDGRKVDLVLKFGERKIVIEFKYLNILDNDLINTFINEMRALYTKYKTQYQMDLLVLLLYINHEKLVLIKNIFEVDDFPLLGMIIQTKPAI